MRHLVWVCAVAVIQGATFLVLLGEQIGRAEHFEAARYESRVLAVGVAILSAPVFYLVRPEWTFWLRPYLGDDLWIIVLLAVVNALCWGASAAGLVWWWRRRRSTVPSNNGVQPAPTNGRG